MVMLQMDFEIDVIIFMTLAPEMDVRFSTRNVRSLYRLDSLKTVARELGKYKLDLEVVQVRWDKGGTERAEVIHSSMERVMKIIT
jgi:hypothetical protein